MKGKTGAIVFALMAAVLYAINVPVSKILLEGVGPTMLAALLYLGAGLGVGLCVNVECPYFNFRHELEIRARFFVSLFQVQPLS